METIEITLFTLKGKKIKSVQKDIEKLMLEKNVPALGPGCSMVYGDKKVEYGDVLRLLQALQQGMEKGKQVKLMTIISDGNG